MKTQVLREKKSHRKSYDEKKTPLAEEKIQPEKYTLAGDLAIVQKDLKTSLSDLRIFFLRHYYFLGKHDICSEKGFLKPMIHSVFIS